MKLLTNRYGSYLTGDELADAAIGYSLALARRRELDVVDIPFIAADGLESRVQFTVGWNTGTAAISSTGPRAELIEAETTRGMNERAAHLGIQRAYPFSTEELAGLSRQHRSTAEWI